MASRTRRRWCAAGVLLRLTLTLSGLCGGCRCAVTGVPATTTVTPTVTMTPVIGPKDCIGGARVQSKGEVKLAVIAPGDHHEQSLPRVLPAVLLAVRYISSPKGPLPGWNIKVDHRDSHCSSTYGPLAAFEFYINQTAGRTSALATLSLAIVTLLIPLRHSLYMSFPSPAFVYHLRRNRGSVRECGALSGTRFILYSAEMISSLLRREHTIPIYGLLLQQPGLRGKLAVERRMVVKVMDGIFEQANSTLRSEIPITSGE